MSQALKFEEFITAGADDVLTTHSLRVAAVHRKRHNDMLRLIRSRIEEAGEWGLRNFAQGVHYDPRNEQHHPKFTMTKDGYQFLVGRMLGTSEGSPGWSGLTTDERSPHWPRWLPLNVAGPKESRQVHTALEAVASLARASLTDHNRNRFCENRHSRPPKSLPEAAEPYAVLSSGRALRL